MDTKKLLEIMEVLDSIIIAAQRMRKKCWALYRHELLKNAKRI